jgi:hypothetical protein
VEFGNGILEGETMEQPIFQMGFKTPEKEREDDVVTLGQRLSKGSKIGKKISLLTP